MNKFYDVSEFPNLIKKDDSVQIFGCPFFLEINDVVRDYVVDAFCWNSPINVLIITQSIEYVSDLMNKLRLELKGLSVDYVYDKSSYSLSDYNSEIKMKLIGKKDDIKVSGNHYDLSIIHFCEDNVESIFDKVCQISKKIVFLTKDDEESIYYSLKDFDNFYRLFSDHSNKKIAEFNQSEVIDEKAKQLVEGKFN